MTRGGRVGCDRRIADGGALVRLPLRGAGWPAGEGDHLLVLGREDYGVSHGPSPSAGSSAPPCGPLAPTRAILPCDLSRRRGLRGGCEKKPAPWVRHHLGSGDRTGPRCLPSGRPTESPTSSSSIPLQGGQVRTARRGSSTGYATNPGSSVSSRSVSDLLVVVRVGVFADDLLEGSSIGDQARGAAVLVDPHDRDGAGVRLLHSRPAVASTGLELGDP